MAVIYILWLRQIKRYLRSKSRIIGSLAQPALYMAAMGMGFGPIYSQAGEGNYLQFLAPGIVAMSLLFTSIFTGLEIIWDRQFGFLKETLVAPVSRFQIMLGRTLGGATVATFQGSMVLIIAYLAGFRVVSWVTALWALPIMILVSLFFTGLGTSTASLLDDAQGFQLIMNFLIMPIFFLSGALFPLKELPAFLNIIIKFNPLSYGVDGLRGALSGMAVFGLPTDLAVLVAVTVVMLAIGSYLFSKIQI